MIHPDQFRQAMRHYASGVCVVAAGDETDRAGMTVSSMTSVSAEPPMILVCINRSSRSHDSLANSDYFSVNILTSGQSDIAMTFAGATKLKGAAKFEVGEWKYKPVPIIEKALYSLICQKHECYEAGSHSILVGNVTESFGNGIGEALINFDGKLQPVARS